MLLVDVLPSQVLPKLPKWERHLYRREETHRPSKCSATALACDSFGYLLLAFRTHLFLDLEPQQVPKARFWSGLSSCEFNFRDKCLIEYFSRISMMSAKTWSCTTTKLEKRHALTLKLGIKQVQSLIYIYIESLSGKPALQRSLKYIECLNMTRIWWALLHLLILYQSF